MQGRCVLHCAWDLVGTQEVQAYLASLHFALLDFADTAFFSHRLKVCGSPLLSKSMVLFSVTFAHVVSLHHNLTILSIFNIFHYCYIWIFDVTIAIVLGYHGKHPCSIVKLINKYCMCPDCSTSGHSPSLSPSPQASQFPET